MLFDDYPKLGVWPDGYYAAFDMFRNNSFVGSEPVVFDRASMDGRVRPHTPH